jgi:alkanesulfonate monooxygenase SsuD/methylene tetrahydromethanopterin reductase-like flavin-dependent oxidoreductase (luciferase family)/FAD/FMN-containing dehydrogenase
MPDYGLPLLFGTFLTPSNAHPDATVALAQLAEQSGLDLVSFQDHPYQPAFLDTWTLLSWVAARTESIHVAPNVMSLPMRPPAVTARAAASLDLLSNGRFDLGLGAGGFWDAIHAMGGRRLTPGQSVDALSEAIDVIRGIWNVDDRAPLRLDGEYYELDGAKRGPQPAHDIPIWLGAYKPRMLRLTGRKADGWLPSLPYMQPGDLAAGNAIIDEAALAAGRDPREIRRLLNIGGRFTPTNGGPLVGPPEQWVEELLPYALDDGIATFIVMGDDPAIIQRFAAEVAPALREAVARERAASGVAQGVVRRASALALRRHGIDYDAIPASLAAAAVEPGDNGYSRVRSTYMRGGSPGLVLRASTSDEVVDALRYARSQPVEFGIRSGGHGISGRSTNDGGIIIDVSRLDSVEVLDEETRTVRIGPGARWVDVAASLARHGWALSSGDYGGVGVGGLATAGGIGWLAREHGLTIDHLTAVELVLADGTIARASADENPDLFWAMRGAGANFGIATAFEFRVDEVGDVGFAQLVFDATDVAGLLERWGAAVEAAPRDLTSFLILTPARRGQPAIAHTMTVVDSSDPDTIIKRLEPLAAIAPLLDQSVQLLPYSAVMANTSGEPHHGQGEPVARTGFIEHVTEEFAQAAADLIATGATHFFQLRSVGGAVSDVPADTTAYAYRSANFCVAAFGSDPERLDEAMESMTELFQGMYLSFSTEIRVDKAFPPKTLERLQAIKVRYDPENVFRDNFNVAPLLPALQA